MYVTAGQAILANYLLSANSAGTNPGKEWVK